MTDSVAGGLYLLRDNAPPEKQMHVMTKMLDLLEIGELVISGPSFMFPLFSNSETKDELLSMSEALDLGLIEFGETSLAGNVPEINIENRGARPVFLLDGEQLLGLKQNRTFNLSMLIPGCSKTLIPVSCLESGRWAASPVRAQAAEHVHFARGRANKLRSVTESLRRAGSYRSDQHQVWSDISSKFQDSGERSETAAEADLYATRRDRLECLSSSFAARPRQIGAAVGVGSKLVGIDLFLTPRLYASLNDKLLKSYLLDALDSCSTPAPPGRDVVIASLRRLFAGEPERFPSPGAGEAFRWSGEHGSAAALISEGKCVHAVAFCADD